MSSPVSFLQRAAARRTRGLLVRRARMQPRAEDEAGAERRVFIVLMNAFGMGGIVRTTLNLAGHLGASGYDVTILSVIRRVDEPFFGPPPPGVKVVTLDDRRSRPGWRRPLARYAWDRKSVLMHPDDRSAGNFSLLADWRLVQELRGRTGFLVTTRPGINLIAVQLEAPGLIRIGQEHMNMGDHSPALLAEIGRRYHKLAVLGVLTATDRRDYRNHLPRKRPRIVRIPNAVRDMGPVHADPAATTAIAAGRFVKQKGFDRLIKSWEIAVREHPGWKLRIIGRGRQEARLRKMIEKRGLGGSVALVKPSRNLGAEMAKASIFVLSSRWEGLPLVLLEAMSVGMAVVSMDCPTGPADVVKDHVNGLLIRPQTIAALAEGLDEMMSDAELRARSGAAAVETARGYRMDVIGPMWEAELQRAWERLRSPG